MRRIPDHAAPRPPTRFWASPEVPPMETVPHNRRTTVRWPVHLLARCLREDRRCPLGNRRRGEGRPRGRHPLGTRGRRGRGTFSPPRPTPGVEPGRPRFFYDERGDKAMEVRIRWVRSGPDGAWSAGAQFTGEREGPPGSCFRDFLRVSDPKANDPPHVAVPAAHQGATAVAEKRRRATPGRRAPKARTVPKNASSPTRTARGISSRS